MFARFRDYLDHRRRGLDAAFSEHVRELVDGSSPSHLETLDTVLYGGKRIRGILTCAISDALGGSLDRAVQGAVAIEMIHVATLIHDDYVDQDRIRRNRPAVWTLEGARKAVLLGDVILASAIQRMNLLGQQEGLVVSRAIAGLSTGACREPLDSSAALRYIFRAPRQYEKIIHLKTGLLFGAACQLGGLAGGAGDELLERLYRYGLYIGEAYQLADDLQEIRRYRPRETIPVEYLTPLAPALLYFAEELRPDIRSALKGSGLILEGRVMDQVQTVERRMETDVQRRLSAAASLLAEGLPDNSYSRLLLQAPREIVAIFDEASKNTI